jgi:hypothetical protein
MPIVYLGKKNGGLFEDPRKRKHLGKKKKLVLIEIPKTNKAT